MNATEEIIKKYSEQIDKLAEINQELFIQNMLLIQYIRRQEALTQARRLYGGEARDNDQR